MSEPTPRPWRVSKAGVFVESRKESICAMFTEDVLMDNYEANADHIVKCVNMHDRFVAACEATLMFYQSWSKEWQEKWDALTGNREATTRGLCDFVRAVLAEDTEEVIVTPVELVVGNEYEVAKTFGPGGGPDTWIAAKCVKLGRIDICDPVFEFERTPGHVIQTCRAEGEYRQKQALVETAEVTG